MRLEDDIVERIMTCCPTFSTLESTIHVSKAFCNVFQTHPMSIMQAVAYNVVGPALPQALRVVRFPYPTIYDEWRSQDETPRGDIHPENMATTCPEELAASVIKAGEQGWLLRNTEVIDSFENIYSLRRAAYRCMLYCNLFPASRFYLDELASLGEERVEEIQRQRKALLSTYPTDELLQLWDVAEFMRATFLTVALGNDEPHTAEILDAVLGTGPDGLYLDGESDSRNRPNIGYFDTLLCEVFKAREVDLSGEDDNCILDTVIGADDTCSQCASPDGIKLLSEANWDCLSLRLSDLLKNNLQHCFLVIKPFVSLTKHIQESDARGPWITGMFALKETPGAWDGWEQDMSYCEPCLVKFLKDHVWKWFLQEKMKTGWLPPENCEYEYNCKEANIQAHASRRNHLCEPIKEIL
ncbi:hypothetical protein K438DRAFT_1984628 [Mycena galopus ATCC 62051]|nr:hypothetical protein K438DRAFT_1984628 [Mycena galopus ATCC 62051]